jgi:DNA modification methylase
MINVEERREWQWWVTNRHLVDKPVHRWYVFPHSFASELVHALIDEWGLGPADTILDPFVGAGTTVLAAKEQGINATGYDLSPLATFATRVKIRNYMLGSLEQAWSHLKQRMDADSLTATSRKYPDLVRKALPGKLLVMFDSIDRTIKCLDASRAERDVLRLALLSTIPRYSRAVATGGWLSWVRKRSDVSSVPACLSARVETMLEDLRIGAIPRRALGRVAQADARKLPDTPNSYSAVITSPPYPNRHDYTRVYGVELMFGFLDWKDTKDLRYQSFHSHPEAHPTRSDLSDYLQPERLGRIVEKIRKAKEDSRLLKMLLGYFQDMYLCLREIARVCRKNAHVAIVVGNAQYRGQPIPVDEFTAELGEQIGLRCEKLLAVRYRGNSAQQMRVYGRKPSRESVVIFRKP